MHRLDMKLVKGDITKLYVDAIVNAANKSLLGGGGVDGAIHRAAGPGLLEECRALDGCEIGEAKITNGHKLPARYVIHTVGPVWKGGNQNEHKLLANCYVNSLKLATEHQCKSIAFPNISTGIYGFPKTKAAEIALNSTQEFLENTTHHIEVQFVCFDEENHNLYSKLM